jgi:translocation and assembly module TamA
LRLLVQSERTFDLNYLWHLHLRGEVGTTFVSNFADLPFTYRFKAGGDRSVRGFAHESLSPTQASINSDGETVIDRVGGQHMVTGSVELLRDLPRNLGLATFFDAGNAFDSWGDGLEYAAGIGLRYRLPVVSIGFDVAKPLSTGGKYRLHLNITPKL